MLSADALKDLKDSGLLPEHIRARELTSSEIAAVGPPSNVGMGIDGYVIPYFDLYGKLLPYYRVKFLGNVQPKYKGIRGGDNHIYFPPGLWALITQPGCDYIIVTEGEKKAAAAVANGFPAIALAGVDSWRVRTLTLPDNVELTPMAHKGVIKAKLPSGDSHSFVHQDTGVSATGFQEFVDVCLNKKLTVVIMFDTDAAGVRPEVQKAAATFGYELRYQGLMIPCIRQLHLPAKTGQKMGLDDFLVTRGAKVLANLIQICRAKRNAFPTHPNVRNFVASKLQSARMSRKEVQDVAMSVLVELESAGRRLYNVNNHELYYFHEETHTLMLALLNNPKMPLHNTEFGSFLYRQYNISASDTRLIGWLATQFSGERGVETTSTHKVIARVKDKPNCLAYQLSDTHYIIISPNPEKPFEVCANGTNGMLFEQNQVERIDHKLLEQELALAMDQPLEMWWHDVIDEFNFSADTDIPTNRMAANVHESKVLASLLFYVSPWLLRWKGTQLPIELVIGEAGSGKSSLYGLRQEIVTGRIRLTNMTKDIRDWYAGITSYGGLYLLDNVKFTGSDKDYQQRLSDEVCRLITEPDPHVDMRKLYTTSEVVSMPVSTTFAMTSVTQPFFAVDLLQRSAIFEMQSLASTGTHDASWMDTQLAKRGGRVGWLAHHLVVLHKFLFRAIWLGEWQNDYASGHRLANYEQAMMLMAKIFKQDPAWIPKALKLRTEHSVTDTDWTMSALKEFVTAFIEENGEAASVEEMTVSDIVKWAAASDSHAKNPIATNAWKLGRYIQGNMSMIKSTVGMYEFGSKANRKTYRVMIKK